MNGILERIIRRGSQPDKPTMPKLEDLGPQHYPIDAATGEDKERLETECAELLQNPNFGMQDFHKFIEDMVYLLGGLRTTWQRPYGTRSEDVKSNLLGGKGKVVSFARGTMTFANSQELIEDAGIEIIPDWWDKKGDDFIAIWNSSEEPIVTENVSYNSSSRVNSRTNRSVPIVTWETFLPPHYTPPTFESFAVGRSVNLLDVGSRRQRVESLKDVEDEINRRST